MSLPNQPQEENVEKTFFVEQYELHLATYRVISESAARAIAKVLDGHGELVEGSIEYVEVGEPLGMPVEGNEEIAEELRKMNVSVDSVIIPSIRSVRSTN